MDGTLCLHRKRQLATKALAEQPEAGSLETPRRLNPGPAPRFLNPVDHSMTSRFEAFYVNLRFSGKRLLFRLCTRRGPG